MKVLMGLVAGIGIGWFSHQSNAVIDSWTNTPEPFKRFTRYGIGIYIVGIVMSIIKHGFNINAWEDDMKNILTAGIFTGTGVMLGYLTDQK